MKPLDDGVAKLPVFAEPLAAAEAASTKNAASKELRREHLLMRVEPSQSYVSDDFAVADKEFWRGKSGGDGERPQVRE